MADRPLDGAVALVTGAGSGVGAATARRLVRDGAAVALVVRHADRAARLAGEMAASGGHGVPVEADITDPDHAERAVQETLDRFGRLDVLVNNAGVMLLGTALHATLADWERMVRLNVSALLHVTHAAVPHLIDAASTSPRQVADIVNVSSTAGRVARPGASVYHLTRFGLNGFTESLRQELLAERVRVSVVEPGLLDTEPAPFRRIDGAEPLIPEDVADAIGYIVTRQGRVAVNEMLVRAAADQTW